MEKFKRRVVRYLGASVAFVTLTGTFMTMLAATASATPTTLYVLAGATGTSCSGDASTTACPSIGDALAFIAASSSNISPTTIEVGSGTFQEHGLVVSGNVTIMGQGPSSTIIDGTNSGQVVDIGSGNVELSGMTIEHGSSGNGGGILNTGNLTLSNDLLQSNSGSNGGAVYNAATLTATDDTFDQNSVGLDGSGGAIDNGGPATLTNDTFTDNSTGNDGAGGAIANNGSATLTNDTFNQNSVGTYGFGGALFSFSNTHLYFDTFSDNSSSSYSAIDVFISVTIADSVFDETTSCGGYQTTSLSGDDGGYNVESDNSCDFSTSDKVNDASTGLASSLATNNSTGPETLALQSTSDAFEEVPSTQCATVSTDERGDPRPGVPSENCDAGAFELQQDTITYNTNFPDSSGAGIPWQTTSTFFEGTSNPALATVGTMSDPGWAFAGWSTMSTFNDMPSPWTPLGDVTLYALWTPDQETVNFDANGGTGDATVTADYDTSATLPSVPTYPGYTFMGWCSTAESPGTACGQTSYATSGDFLVPLSTTFYALWNPNTETIHLDWNDGSSIVEYETDTFGVPLGYVTTPFDPNYTFAGWCSVQESHNETCSGSTISSGETVFPSVTYYYALFTGDLETVHFDENGGIGDATVNAAYDTSAALPSAPTYPGYTFKGWCDVQESPNVPCPDTALATSGVFTVPASTTYYALWQSIPHSGGPQVIDVTLSFESDGGSAQAPITAQSGTTVTLPTPTYAGYNFDGWYTQSVGGTQVASPLTLTTSTVLYAQWAVTAPATVTFTRLAAIHTFATGSSRLTALEQHQLRALVSRLRRADFSTLRLVGETPQKSTTTSHRLALARDNAVKVYLASHGLKVTYLESVVALGSANSSRVVVVYAR
jgi:uncharacterized repeat protein (TIGR02543 family)